MPTVSSVDHRTRSFAAEAVNKGSLDLGVKIRLQLRYSSEELLHDLRSQQCHLIGL